MLSGRCLIELHYLPCVAWFTAVHRCKEIVLEKHEYFVKQSYRNRFHILGANRVEKLTIPTTAKHNHTLITDIRIDYSQKWLNNHWRSIESAYRNAPYFEHFADALQRVLFSKPAFLYDLNYRLLAEYLCTVHPHVMISESTTYDKVPAGGTVDLRNQISPKHPGFKKFINPAPYTQVFGNTFVPNLSIIDLLFCTGPEAPVIIASGLKPNEQKGA
jgi:hypothetical protein